jgi:hypothetical protein
VAWLGGAFKYCSKSHFFPHCDHLIPKWYSWRSWIVRKFERNKWINNQAFDLPHSEWNRRGKRTPCCDTDRLLELRVCRSYTNWWIIILNSCIWSVQMDLKQKERFHKRVKFWQKIVTQDNEDSL